MMYLQPTMGQQVVGSPEYDDWKPNAASSPISHQWNAAAKPYVPRIPTTTTVNPPTSPAPTTTSDYFSQGSAGSSNGLMPSVMSAYVSTTPSTINFDRICKDIDIQPSTTKTASEATHPVTTRITRPCPSFPVHEPASIEMPRPVRQRETTARRLDDYTRAILTHYPSPNPIPSLTQVILDGTYRAKLQDRSLYPHIPSLLDPVAPWPLYHFQEQPSMLEIWDALDDPLLSPTSEVLRYHPEAIIEFCRGRLFK